MNHLIVIIFIKNSVNDCHFWFYVDIPPAMNKNIMTPILKSNQRPSFLATLIGLASFPISMASALSPSSATVNGAAGSDYWVYSETSPGQLTRNDFAALVPELAGNAASPGGNIELFASSENGTYTSPNGAFASVAPSILTAQIGVDTVTLRSLNGADWFTTGGGLYDTSYGASNLANQWYGDLLNNYGISGALNAAQKQQVFDAWATGGGFARISDPNISYLSGDGAGSFEYGLGGYLDARPQLQGALVDAGYGTMSALVPSGTFSEVVMVNGAPQYGFNATASGVVFDPVLDDYSGNFHFQGATSVPEPSAALLAAISGLLLMTRRRR